MNPIDIKYRFPGQKLLVGLAALMVVLAGLKAAQSVLLPIFFAIFMAILGTPAARYLKRKGLPKALAVLVVAVVLIAALFGIGYLFYNALVEFRSAVPRYQGRWHTFSNQLETLLAQYGVFYSLEEALGSVDATAVVELVGTTFKNVVGLVSVLVVILIMMIFMLYEATDFHGKLQVAMGEAFQEERFSGAAIDMQRYIGIKTITSLITGIIVGTMNYVVGVDFWLLWGLVAYLLNYIPFVGSIIASFPAVILGFMQFGMPTGIGLIVGYLAINNLISNFLEPILMGPRLGLSPLVVFLSLVFWGWLWGPAGMLLSVPLTMVLKILLEHSEEFRWVAILMDNRVAYRASAAIEIDS